MNKHDTLDAAMTRFEERIADKTSNKPKLHRFDCEFRIAVLSPDEEAAQNTVDIICKHLESFEDIEDACGKLV